LLCNYKAMSSKSPGPQKKRKKKKREEEENKHVPPCLAYLSS
jgi:hypothetical protein